MSKIKISGAEMTANLPNIINYLNKLNKFTRGAAI